MLTILNNFLRDILDLSTIKYENCIVLVTRQHRTRTAPRFWHLELDKDDDISQTEMFLSISWLTSDILVYLTDNMLVRVVLSISKYPRAVIGLVLSILWMRYFSCCLSFFSMDARMLSWACLFKSCRHWYASSRHPVTVIRQKILPPICVKAATVSIMSVKELVFFLTKLDKEIKVKKIAQLWTNMNIRKR